jgi:hypothetical protein
LKHPYAISCEFNFIRFLRDYIRKYDAENKEFRTEYDKSILLDKDNYICYESWPYWDTTIVTSLLNSIRDEALKIGKIASEHLVPDVILRYINVGVKQAEFNIDFYVGLNMSNLVINSFPSYFFSFDGKEWRMRCGEIALSHYAPKGNTNLDISSKCGEAGHSFGFKLAKGLFLKMYRKTRDHIRVELLMDRKFIYYKFKGSRDIFTILKPMLEFSKNFFKEIDFEHTLYELISQKQHEFTIAQLYPLYEFFEKWKPPLLDIINSVLYGDPIIMKDAIGLISGDSVLRKLFVRRLTDTGRWVYLYNPEKALFEKEKRLQEKNIIMETEEQCKLRLLGLKGKGRKVDWSQENELPHRVKWVKDNCYGFDD